MTIKRGLQLCDLLDMMRSFNDFVIDYYQDGGVMEEFLVERNEETERILQRLNVSDTELDYSDDDCFDIIKLWEKINFTYDIGIAYNGYDFHLETF